MSNHVHFIAMPDREDSLAKTFNQAHMRYSQYRNKKCEQRGPLWQGRFHSCVLDERHLLAATRYVERNPVRAGVAERAEDYRWSSARAHALGTGDPLLSNDEMLREMIGDWSAYLAEEDDPNWVRALRVSTRSGRPAGNDTFIARVEGIVGRSLEPRPLGRPKGTSEVP
jgi:putative transposase